MGAMGAIGATNAMAYTPWEMNDTSATDTIFAMHALVIDAIAIAIKELNSSRRAKRAEMP